MEEIQDGWYSRQLQCSAEDPSLAGSRLSHEHDTGLASGLTSRSLGPYRGIHKAVENGRWLNKAHPPFR